MSAFSDLVDKLMSKGHSKESATKIAAKIGDEKYGTHDMAKKAAAARESVVQKWRKGGLQ